MKNNPFYDPYRVLNAVYADGARLKQALADTPVDESQRARTVKTAYGVLERDGYLSLCIRTFAPKSPKQSARLILKISLYWLLYLNKPKYAVTDFAVDLCKRLGKGGMAGFINAFLRAFDGGKVTLPAGDEGLSIAYNYPLFAVKRIKAEYGERAERILAAKSHGVCVRFARGEEGYLSAPHEQTPFPHLYLFPNFVRDEKFFAGDYTFQSVGSVAICSAVESCNRLLDACAAPGGKSVLLSQKCANVVAQELHPHRVKLIESYCARMGVNNVTAMQGDSAQFRPEWEGAFDGVLCDVPCSGMGTVAENPDLVLNKTENDLPGLNRVQLEILQTCSRYVKAGGCLYYSTCSLFGEENDGIVNRFLKEHTEYRAEVAECPLLHERTEYGLQFLPDTAFGAGFYVCKMRKIK
ncbi:MAG: hypothetical protein HFE25_01445 [Clostridia bacterium]|nr:hypothetical protein [Clostridia bacterium]